jgi:uncharacterized SAM-binding protein YcdF (DUF218 family)
MFLLSKVLPLMVLPLGLALALLLLGLRRGPRWPVVAAVLVLWVFATPLVADGLWRWLERPYQRMAVEDVLADQRVDAVVVLSGGRHPAPGADRISEWTDADRFFAGIDAYRFLRAQGRPAHLIFTGGWSPLQPDLQSEGETLRAWALSLGLSDADVTTTAKVRNTAEEAEAVVAQVPAGGRVALVTSAFHMTRAAVLFERQGLRVLPFPVDFQAIGRWAGSSARDPLRYVPSADGLESSSRALREAMGRTVYRAW